jgi:hypothetical protein
MKKEKPTQKPYQPPPKEELTKHAKLLGKFGGLAKAGKYTKGMPPPLTRSPSMNIYGNF